MSIPTLRCRAPFPALESEEAVRNADRIMEVSFSKPAEGAGAKSMLESR